MGLIRIIALLAMVTTTGFAAYSTYSRKGADTFEHPEGISLRDESTGRGRRGGFFLFYHSSSGRSHRGGGLRGGK